MDISASLFGLLLMSVSLVVAYRYGIKPERDEKRRRAEQALAEERRQRWERMRKRPTV